MNKLILTFIVSLLSLVAVQAQISLQIKPAKQKYIPGENAILLVTITNESGRALSFKNKGKTPWLSIQAVANAGTELSQIGRLEPQELTLKSGEARTTRINVGSIYDLAFDGMYRVTASLLSPIDGQFYSSQSTMIVVQNGYVHWKKQVGIPAGFPRAGATCRYSVQTMPTNGKTYIYARLDDVELGRIIRSICLGPYINFGKPYANTDKMNRLHVLHLCTADTYCLTIVDPGGKIYPRKFFKRSDEVSADLVKTKDGEVHVRGGIPFDPYAKKDIIPDGADISL